MKHDDITPKSLWLDSAARRLHVNTLGAETAPPLVLLHGGGADSSLLSWGALIEPLSARFRLYLPDWPGYGRSEPRDGTLRSEDLPLIVENLRDHLQIDRLDMVGISMGGLASVAYALEYPDRVGRIAVFGCGGLQNKAPYHGLAWLFLHLPVLAEPLARWQWRVFSRRPKLLRNSLRALLPSFREIPSELVEMVQAELAARTDDLVFFRWQRDEIRLGGLKTDMSSRLGEIHAPVLMLHGTKDLAVPVRHARSAAGRLPRCRYVEFTGGGHWLPREAPQPAAERLVPFFLGELPTEGHEELPLV